MALFASGISSFLQSTTFVYIKTKVHLKLEFDTYDVIMTSRYVEQNCFGVRETNLIFFYKIRRYLIAPLNIDRHCEMTFDVHLWHDAVFLIDVNDGV